MIELNKIYNEDCLEGMKRIPDGSVDCIVTDIPYNECNRADNGLRNLDKDKADIGMFDVDMLTKNLCDKTKGSIYMFCGFNQVSTIRQAMSKKGLSTRIIVWEKTNPSPMNGSVIWLSGVELCVYGKKKAQHSISIARTPSSDTLVWGGGFIRHRSQWSCWRN